MFYHDNKLQYEVKVDEPNPQFAKMLPQAIGGTDDDANIEEDDDDDGGIF